VKIFLPLFHTYAFVFVSAFDRMKGRLYFMKSSKIFLMKKICAALCAFTVPRIASAQNPQGDLQGLVVNMGYIVNLLVPIVSTLVVVFFFWGLAMFVLSAGDEEQAKKGKNIMIWGIFSLFLMITIWGIVGFMQNTIGNTYGPASIDVTLPGITPGQVL